MYYKGALTNETPHSIIMKTLAISKTCAALALGIIVGSSNAEAGLWTSILKTFGRKVVEEGGERVVKQTIKTGAIKVASVLLS